MIAKIAYLTTPAPNRYILHFQAFGSDTLTSIEISQAHLANIIIDGTTLALRNIDNRSVPNRVPAASQTEDTHERA